MLRRGAMELWSSEDSLRMYQTGYIKIWRHAVRVVMWRYDEMELRRRAVGRRASSNRGVEFKRLTAGVEK